MAMIYYDKSLDEEKDNRHPAFKLDRKHPCYAVKREAVGKKSVIQWTKSQAYAMYKWYCEGWRSPRWEDEFGEQVAEYDFKDTIKTSHYLIGKKPSPETIEEMYQAAQMERKILDSIGEEEEKKE